MGGSAPIAYEREGIPDHYNGINWHKRMSILCLRISVKCGFYNADNEETGEAIIIEEIWILEGMITSHICSY